MLVAVTHAPVPGRVEALPGGVGAAGGAPKPATRLHNIRRALEGAPPWLHSALRRPGACPHRPPPALPLCLPCTCARQRACAEPHAANSPLIPPSHPPSRPPAALRLHPGVPTRHLGAERELFRADQAVSVGLLQDIRACPAFRRVGGPQGKPAWGAYAAAAGGAAAAGRGGGDGAGDAPAEQAGQPGAPGAEPGGGTPAVHLTKLSNSVLLLRGDERQ